MTLKLHTLLQQFENKNENATRSEHSSCAPSSDHQSRGEAKTFAKVNQTKHRMRDVTAPPPGNVRNARFVESTKSNRPDLLGYRARTTDWLAVVCILATFVGMGSTHIGMNEYM